MGEYTEIYVNANLRKDTPQGVLDVLQAICDKDSKAECLQDKPARWHKLFTNGSEYVAMTSCGILKYDEQAGQHTLLGKGDIQNFEGDIEAFFEFVAPWCEGEFIGYYRYEEDREPSLVFCNEQITI